MSVCRALSFVLAAIGVVSIPSIGFAAEWSDTSIGLQYGKKYRFPANPNDVAITNVNLQHASGYSLGHNFFNVAILQSDSKDPAQGGGGGAREIYVVYRNQVFLSRLMDRPFEFGPVSDLGVTFGFDAGAKNDSFSAAPLKWLVGPTLNFKVPGYLTASVLYRGERNRNGIPGAPFPKVRYDNTWGVSSNWGISFEAGLPMLFRGFLEHTGTKGLDGFGGPTAQETYLDAALLLDVGSLVMERGKTYVGVGYLYRRNKFGVPGVSERVPTVRAEVHF